MLTHFSKLSQVDPRIVRHPLLLFRMLGCDMAKHIRTIYYLVYGLVYVVTYLVPWTILGLIET